MNRTYLALIIVLLLAVAGAAATYQFYVKERIAELGRAKQEAEQLEAKTKEMEATFHRTKPDVVLAEFRDSIEPWRRASTNRHEYFRLPDRDIDVAVPEEQRLTVKFWYKDEIGKRMDTLQADARAKRVGIPPASTLYNVFNIRDPESLTTGVNATPGEASRWLTNFESAAALLRLLMDGGASQILDVVAWEPRNGPQLRSGRVRYLTTGLHFQIPFPNLVDFLDDLRMEPRYVTVDAIRITNRDLFDRNGRVTVEMLLTQAEFVSGQAGDAEDQPGADAPAAAGQQGYMSSLVEMLQQRRESLEEEETSKKGFLDTIVSWFPF